MKKLLISLLFISINLFAAQVELNWNNSNNENCWVNYGEKDGVLAVYKNVGNVNKYIIEIPDGKEYFFYIKFKNGTESNIVYFKSKDKKERKSKEKDIKLEVKEILVDKK